MRTITRLTATIALIALAAGAGTSLAGPPDTGTALVLTLRSPDRPGDLNARIADRFARAVAARSDGSIKVKVAYEQDVAGQVRSRTLDLGAVPSFDLDAAGVRTFRALRIPFLAVTEQRLAALTTGQTATQLQAGLDSVGLVGLGLVPEGFRRIFTLSRPLRAPEDFDGLRVNVPNAQNTPLYRALGAKPSTRRSDVTGALINGQIDAFETSLGRVRGILPDGRGGIVTGNLALYPKVDVLVMQRAAFARLSADKQRVLRAAAADARSSTLERETERAHAREFCSAGGKIVAAPTADLAAIRARLQPIAAALLRQPEVARVARRITALPSGRTVVTCGSAASSAPSPARVTSPPPSGTYRRILTAAGLRSQGVEGFFAQEHAGTVDLTVKKSAFTLVWRATTGRERPGTNGFPPCAGFFTLDGGLLSLNWTTSNCSYLVELTWEKVAGGIRIVPTTVTGVNERGLFGGVWKRVG